MNTLLTSNVGRRGIQTLPNRRPHPQSRRTSRSIPLPQKSTGILTPAYIPGPPKPLRRTNERANYAISAPTYTYITRVFIIKSWIANEAWRCWEISMGGITSLQKKKETNEHHVFMSCYCYCCCCGSGGGEVVCVVFIWIWRVHSFVHSSVDRIDDCIAWNSEPR